MLRGINSDALRAAFLSGEFIALGQANTPFSVIGDRSVSRKRRSGYCPAIVQALRLLSSRALSSRTTAQIVRKTWRKSTFRPQMFTMENSGATLKKPIFCLDNGEYLSRKYLRFLRLFVVL
jgi:hypothetical protein